jgi:hypothetical protein
VPLVLAQAKNGDVPNSFEIKSFIHPMKKAQHALMMGHAFSFCGELFFVFVHCLSM